MSLRDFLKRVFVQEEEPHKIKRVSLDDLSYELEKETKEIDNAIRNVISNVRERAILLDTEIGEHLKILKNFSLEERKEQERIKSIVIENLGFYVSYLEELRDKLSNLTPESEDYLGKINSVFDSFQKNSAKSFEKATILIGKELADVKKSLKNFSEDVNRMLNDSKYAFEKEKEAIKLKERINNWEQQKKAAVEIQEISEKLQHKIEELEKNKEQIKNELESLTKSREYEEAIEEKRKIEEESEKALKNITNLEKEINTKELARHFHSDKKKNEIIKSYIENFREALQNDSNLEILELVKEAKPSTDTEIIKQEISGIRELKKHEEGGIEKSARKLREEINRIDFEILESQEEIINEKKKIQRLFEREDGIKEEIKNQARILWKSIEITEI